jgi:PAS domain S-box-containing protein
MTAMLGFSDKQLMEKSAAEFVHAEDRSDFQKHVYVDSVLGDTVLQHTFRLVREDGSVRWLRNNGVVIDWEGRPATLNFLEDITARKEMEDALAESREQFRLFMKYIPGFALIKDETGKVLYINERVHDVFGWSADDIVGGTDADRWPMKVADEFRKDDLTVIRTGKVIERVEVLEAQNRPVALLTYKFPILKKDGKALVGIMAIDITERKETEDELRTTKEQLEIEREALEKKNVALGEILQRIETEKDALKRQFATNVEEAILPTLMRLKESAGEAMRRNFELIEHELRDVASPFLTAMKGKFTRLSPRELEVCRLIKNGMTTKEIAEVLNLSPMTVQKHREIIRKKLGLVNNQTNLNTYLQSMK